MCEFSHVHNAVALSTEIYCSLGDKEPFVWELTFHMNRHTAPVCPLSGLSICHSAANQQLQRLTLNHPHPFPFSPCLKVLYHSDIPHQTIQIYADVSRTGLVDPLLSVSSV